MKPSLFKVAVWKEGSVYVSQCLNVDVSSFGKSKQAALKNLEEALELYYEDRKTPSFIKVERPAVVSLTLRHA